MRHLKTDKILIILMVFLMISVQGFATHFDFQSIRNLSKVEIGLSKGNQWGLGKLRGAFKRVRGNINFSFENPNLSTGVILLDARALRFGFQKLNNHAHQEEWLNSNKFPEISFKLKKLSNLNWKNNVLLANADGALQMKGSTRDISIPVTIKYLRAGRRKYDGKRGDILFVAGEIPLNRTDFGISSDDMFDLIKDNISVKVSLVGSSDKCRSLLPSRLFF